MSTPNVADFFLRVVPWPAESEPGYINIHWRSANVDHGFPGRPFRNVVELMDGVAKFQKRPKSILDLYFCLSRQEVTGKDDKRGHPWAKRHKSTALALKCIALDIDVKPEKGYDSVLEAVQALGKFVADTSLPSPTALVFSGGGIHVYWISDRALTVDEWAPYAAGLRALADQHQLRFDPSCTIDSARILRVPGTYNLKEQIPREVKLKSLAPADLNFERELACLRTSAAASAAPAVRTGSIGQSEQWVSVTLPSRPPSPELFTAEYQAEIGIVYEDKPPLDPVPILKACPFFKKTAITGGKGHDQGLWMQTALACTFMENGREVFHVLSKGDPRYDPDTVDKMFDRKVAEREEKDFGWPSCQKFEEYGSAQCAGCPHRGKVRSPLNLPIDPAPSPKTSEPVSIPGAPWLPKGYYWHPETGYPMVEITTKDGREFGIAVLNHKITDIWTQDDVGVNFTVERGMDPPKDLVIKYEDLTSETMVSTAFAKQKVTVHEPKRLAEFMKTLIEEYQKRKRSLMTVPFGWWTEKGAADPGGWAYNGVVRKSDGTVLPAAKAEPATREIYTPRGSLDTWFSALKLITAQHRPDVEVIAAVAFASPLLRFTGHFSGALVARSDSGGNKSTAVNVGGAVWGQPRKAKFTPSASSVAIRLRLSQTNNLPCYWDDIRKEHIPAACALLSDLTQGADGLKARANRDLHETGTWQTILCMCSNGSLFDHFVATNKSDAAGLYRIFEYTVSPKETAAPGSRINELDATYLQQQLEENYGIIGDIYSQVLANTLHMKELVRSTHERLSKELGYAESEQERFWMALVTTIVLGAKLANEIGASFNVNEIHQFLLKAYREMRAKLAKESPIGEEKENAAHAVTEFLQEYGANMLWSHTKITRPGRGQSIGFIKGPDDKDPIYIHWVTDEPELRIQKNKFAEFLGEKYTATVVYAALKKHFNATDDTKASLSSGTQNPGGGSMWLICMPVPPGSEFEGTLRAHEPKTSATRSGLSVVAGGKQGTD